VISRDGRQDGDQLFNEFFGSVFTEENLLTLPKIKQLGGEDLHTLSDVVISEAIIVKELR